MGPDMGSAMSDAQAAGVGSRRTTIVDTGRNLRLGSE